MRKKLLTGYVYLVICVYACAFSQSLCENKHNEERRVRFPARKHLKPKEFEVVNSCTVVLSAILSR